MLPHAAAEPAIAARFVQEARAAAEVQSEHVVRVLDVGSLDDGSPFIVMEFLRGRDFARLVRAHGPLPVVDVAGYLLQACEAVAEAHTLGIVHRDLKPANLFLTARADGSPLVKVLDFGISKLTRRGAPVGALTKSRSVMGTPLYMSPEQLRDAASVGPATDVWSLGCILHELLAGKPPFLAESAEALGALIASGPTPRIRASRPEVPIELEEVIVRCLEKEPAARFASVGELAQRIGPFAPSDMAPLVGRVGRISARTHASSEPPHADAPDFERPPRFAATGEALARSRSGSIGLPSGARPFWIGAGVLVVGLLGLVVARGPWSAPSPSPALASTFASPSAMQGTATGPAPWSSAPAPSSPAAETSSVPAASSSAGKKLPVPPKARPAAARSSGSAKGYPAVAPADRDAIE
jgi:serine/threonine-protein kinase